MQDQEQYLTISNKYKYSVNKESLLGSGAFGKVFKCYSTDQNDKTEYCVKIIEKNPSQTKKDEDRLQKQIQNELQAMQQLRNQNCENLVYTLDTLSDASKYYQIMEKCDHDLDKELTYQLHQQEWFKPEQIFNIIYQICNGLKVLYQYKIIHRDIKPENILLKFDTVNERQIFKISDFGFSRLYQNIYNKSDLTRVGTPSYVAPQLFFDAKFSGKCDIFSCGILFYQIIHKKKFPYNVSSQNHVKENLKKLQYYPLKIPKSTDLTIQKLNEIIEKMVIYDEEQRIGIEEIMEKLNIIATQLPFDSFRHPIDRQAPKTDIVVISNSIQEMKEEERQQKLQNILEILLRKVEKFEVTISTLEFQNMSCRILKFILQLIQLEYLLQGLSLIFGIISDIPKELKFDSDGKQLNVFHLMEIIKICQLSIHKYKDKQQKRQFFVKYYFQKRQQSNQYRLELEKIIRNQQQFIKTLKKDAELINQSEFKRFQIEELFQMFNQYKIQLEKELKIDETLQLQLSQLLSIEKNYPIEKYSEINPDEIIIIK